MALLALSVYSNGAIFVGLIAMIFAFVLTPVVQTRFFSKLKSKKFYKIGLGGAYILSFIVIGTADIGTYEDSETRDVAKQSSSGPAADANARELSRISQSSYYGMINKTVRGVDYNELAGKPCKAVMNTLKKTKSVGGDAMIIGTFVFYDDTGKPSKVSAMTFPKYDCDTFVKGSCPVYTSEGETPLSKITFDPKYNVIASIRLSKGRTKYTYEGRTVYHYDRVAHGIVETKSYKDGNSKPEKELESLLCVQPRER